MLRPDIYSTMNIAEYTALISAVVSAVILLTNLYLNWRKAKPEEKKTKADALSATSDAASKTAEMFNKAMDEIGELREQQAILEKKIDDLEKTLKQAVRERNAAFNWAARLIKQMKDRDPEIVPVEYITPEDTESHIKAIKMGKHTDGS